MRILLVAYDFPPLMSPRALRWRYLVRELILGGHDVNVLTPNMGQLDVDFPDGPGTLRIRQTTAGLFGWLARRGSIRLGARRGVGVAEVSCARDAQMRLNWRGRTVEYARKLANIVLFPDFRLEWAWLARRPFRLFLAAVAPDVVITSHEPAVTLGFGLMARRQGFPWVADMGDPVCTSYTLRHWQKRALRLEAKTLQRADAIIVPGLFAQDLYVARHDVCKSKFCVLPQAYDDRAAEQHRNNIGFDPDLLELLFVGRLYTFRDPRPMLAAVETIDGVRVTFVLATPPPPEIAAVMERTRGIRLFDGMSHESVKELESQADVLLSIGNRGMDGQMPGKIHEYCGIRRPILHVAMQLAPDDMASRFVLSRRRGWACGDDAKQIHALLEALVVRKRQGNLVEDLRLAPLQDYAVSKIAGKLVDLLEGVVESTGLPSKHAVKGSPP